jgi:hypothetical protein
MDIHVCAVSIAEHVNVHHEVSLVNQLIDAMPKGARVNALKAWFVSFAKVTYCEETKVFIPKRSDALDLTEAIETPWFDFKKEPEFSVIDSMEVIAKALKVLEKAMEGENAAKHKINAKHVEALRLVVNA